MKKKIAGTLYWLQYLSLGITACVQSCHMLGNGITGVNIAQFLSGQVAMALQLFIVIGAHRRKATPNSVKTIRLYTYYLIVFGGVCAALLYELYLAPANWDAKENLTVAIVVGLVAISFAISRRLRLPLHDAVTGAMFSLSFRALPQLITVWKIVASGGGGWSWIFILLGHFLIGSRVALMFVLREEATWDRNRKAAFGVELANETSWLLVTIAWLAWWLRS